MRAVTSTVLIALIATTLSSCRDGGSGGASAGAARTEKVTIRGEPFELEVAADAAARAQGLKHRASVDDHGGMLFIHPRPEVQSYWMHECLVDIDIIYLDSRGTVTATHRMKAEPLRQPHESEEEYQARMRQPSYSSALPAQFAIELKAGWLDQLHLNVDERIELDLARLKAMAR